MTLPWESCTVPLRLALVCANADAVSRATSANAAPNRVCHFLFVIWCPPSFHSLRVKRSTFRSQVEASGNFSNVDLAYKTGLCPPICADSVYMLSDDLNLFVLTANK